MTCEEFSNVYWSHFIALEKEFAQTTSFVTINEANYSTYSSMFAKLLLETCSEIDVTFKLYCSMLSPSFNGKKLNAYMMCMNQVDPLFSAQKVEIRGLTNSIQPWINFSNNNAPFWWTAYNRVKHNRTEDSSIDGVSQKSFMFANLKNTVAALAALYQIEVMIYYQLALSESKTVQTPLPGSRFFRLLGTRWDDVMFYGDYAFYIQEDTGHLIMEASNIHY